MKNIAIFKIYSKEEIRIINFERTKSLNDLQKKIYELFNLKENEISLKYLDKEGDKITFSIQEEFESLLENYQENDIIKIYIFLKKENDNKFEKIENWKENWREKKLLRIQKFKEDKKYEKEIEILISKGFNDEFRNYRLLNKFEGDVERVIQKLNKKKECFKEKKECYNWKKHLKKKSS